MYKLGYYVVYIYSLGGTTILSIHARSHIRMVVRECCKGDDASQWENGKFDPFPRPTPLTDRHKKLHTWLRHGPSLYVVEASDLNTVTPGNLLCKYADDSLLTLLFLPVIPIHD